MDNSAIIQHAINRFASGEVDGCKISPLFRKHDGLSASEWLIHERAEFARRCGHFGLKRNSIRVRVREHAGDIVKFDVLNDRGEFAYEDVWHLDSEGAFIGNGNSFEAVTKLIFEQGAQPRRSIAFRNHHGSIISILPIGVDCHDVVFTPDESGDGYSTITFSIANDSLRDLPCRFRIREGKGKGATETVTLRGRRDNTAQLSFYPEIDGRFVYTPHGGRIWSLHLHLVNGMTVHYEMPTFDRIELEHQVAAAIVTDIYDHDWLTTSGR